MRLWMPHITNSQYILWPGIVKLKVLHWYTFLFMRSDNKFMTDTQFYISIALKWVSFAQWSIALKMIIIVAAVLIWHLMDIAWYLFDICYCCCCDYTNRDRNILILDSPQLALITCFELACTYNIFLPFSMHFTKDETWHFLA